MQPACKPILPLFCSQHQMACTQGSTLFQPATQWTQDTNDHILRVCLPGFQKDEFKVQVDNCGKLTIRGKRPLGDGKYMRLEQVFDVPKDSHIDKIRGKFEDARLSLFMPKKVVTEKETQRAVSCDKNKKQETPPQKPNSGPVADDKLEEYKKKALAWKVKFEEQLEGWLDYGLIDGFLETISKNKKTIAVATAAFTAGFYISRKLRSS
uniref:LOW QUALITY PROTEIN: inactive protein RESTRICTED TEV MOVEMENT 2 n=2 Tax=Elaeis guineensis var. tenera TaxID=51953 RepID=A0A8N4I7L8_ELAGV|nr:LOW QUALITY PROTEIN: inactive protein RESTRICTED TEV MOVEMENT 2 [Elaeis guineensis]